MLFFFFFLRTRSRAFSLARRALRLVFSLGVWLGMCAVPDAAIVSASISVMRSVQRGFVLRARSKGDAGKFSRGAAYYVLFSSCKWSVRLPLPIL